MTARERFLFILLFLIGMLGVFYFKGRAAEQRALFVQQAEDVRYERTFGAIKIGAKAAYVYDLTDGQVLYAKSENMELPLASLTKVMTALTALRSEEPRATVSISSLALQEEGDSGLLVGERWRLADLVEFMLVSSSNDAAAAIALAASPDGTMEGFLEQMHAQTSVMELHRTSFLNPTGLDASDLSSTGGTGTAKEMTRIFIALLTEFPEVFPETSVTHASFVSLDGTVHAVKNTNIAVDTMPALVASKTGFTDLAGGNLAVIASVGIQHPIAVTVLGSTQEGRFADVEELLNAAIRYIAFK